MKENDHWPTVSVVIPCRDEANFIEACVRSVAASDYPAEKLEIVVVDGLSVDESDLVVGKLAADDSRIRLCRNPRRIMPAGTNLGIAHSHGDIIIVLGAHAQVAKSFVRQNAAALLERSDAWCVGGTLRTVGLNYVGSSIAAAMTSFVGVGNALFRLGGRADYVDHVAFPACWRWVFDKIGVFDEELVRNQDDDFSFRIRRAGGRIYLTPSIISTYYTRASAGKLWRQYYQYGVWRVRTIQKHGRPATVRQIVPLAFVSSILVLAALAFFFRWARPILAAEFGVYFFILILGAIDVASKGRLRYAAYAPVAFAVLHSAYGLGCLAGIWRFVIRGRGTGDAVTKC